MHPVYAVLLNGSVLYRRWLVENGFTATILLPAMMGTDKESELIGKGGSKCPCYWITETEEVHSEGVRMMLGQRTMRVVNTGRAT